MRALEENNTKKMDTLLSHTQDINARDKSGQTALFYAAHYAGNPQVVHQLILAGADPLVKDKQGYTPLMTAARFNAHPKIVLTLARHGGASAEQQANKDAALLIAAQYNTLPVIKNLLITHASPLALDKDGKGLADRLEQNQQISVGEKFSLRQALLVLEILDGREQFSSLAYKPALHKEPPSEEPPTKSAE